MYVCVCVWEREREMILPMQSMARVNDNSLKREKLINIDQIKEKEKNIEFSREGWLILDLQ